MEHSCTKWLLSSPLWIPGREACSSNFRCTTVSILSGAPKHADRHSSLPGIHRDKQTQWATPAAWDIFFLPLVSSLFPTPSFPPALSFPPSLPPSPSFTVFPFLLPYIVITFPYNSRRLSFFAKLGKRNAKSNTQHIEQSPTAHTNVVYLYPYLKVLNSFPRVANCTSTLSMSLQRSVRNTGT